MTDPLQVKLTILCDDPKLKLIWGSVVKQVNRQNTIDLGESFDLLSELLASSPNRAACLREVVFGEIPDKPSEVGRTSILTGVSVTEPDQANGRIVFSV